MSPDDFADAAREKILLAFRDEDSVSKNLTFGEGYKLASEIANDMAAIYRGAMAARLELAATEALKNLETAVTAGDRDG